MKGLTKLFIASLLLFACSAGFFLGSLCNRPHPFGAEPPCTKMMPPPDHGRMGPDHGGPKHNKAFQHNNKADFHKGNFKAEGPSPELIDSVLQVTPEQKAQLEQQRNRMDSSFKDLRNRKHDAEKELSEALDSGNDQQIADARNKILSFQEAMLDGRISGAKELSNILTKEQLNEFKKFQKEHFKKFNQSKHGKQGPGQERPEQGTPEQGRPE